VRILLALLLTIGVLAGSVGRAMTHSHHAACQTSNCAEVVSACKESITPAHSSCCPSENQSSSQDNDKQNSDGSEHHHHHICCGMPNVIGHDGVVVGFCGLEESRVALNLENHSVPENPVFELDTPPLI